MVDLFPIVKQTLLITLFVMSMMLIIEYLNVFTRGILSEGLKKSKWKQLLLATLLGVIPGCLGAYTAVSLYIHDIIGTGAIVSTMIATSGDEAFAMFSLFPEKALLLSLILFVIAIGAGLIVNRFFKKNLIRHMDGKHMHIHEIPECTGFQPKTIGYQLRHITPTRALILMSILFFITFFILDEQISGGSLHGLINLGKAQHEASDPRWVKITFYIVIILSSFVILIVNDHFLEKHLWGHIIKKHFTKIFLWTFFTLLVIHIGMKYYDLSQVIHQNIFWVLIAAILIGIIPESGPHLIFVILFANGTLPFSILLASSIVQDGHGSLPLLAESRKAFVIVKSLNMAVGLIVGLAGIALGI
jgi:hypothetical protein